MTDLAVRFQGPFSWNTQSDTRSVFNDPLASEAGLYLWTVPTPAGELIYYVGETGRSFATRMYEHLKEHLAGAYHVHDPVAFLRGEKRELWPGLCMGNRAAILPQLLQRFAELAVPIAQLVDVYRFHLAPTNVDLRLRQRIEAALSHHLYAQPGLAGQFQDQGIRYHPRRLAEPPMHVRLSSSRPLVSLPEALEV